MRKRIPTPYDIAQLNDTRLQRRIQRIEARQRRKHIFMFVVSAIPCFIISLVLSWFIREHKLP